MPDYLMKGLNKNFKYGVLIRTLKLNFQNKCFDIFMSFLGKHCPGDLGHKAAKT